MTKPTSLVRDSSLWIEYGPRDCGVLSGSADRNWNIECIDRLRQWHALKLSKFNAKQAQPCR